MKNRDRFNIYGGLGINILNDERFEERSKAMQKHGTRIVPITLSPVPPPKDIPRPKKVPAGWDLFLKKASR